MLRVLPGIASAIVTCVALSTVSAQSTPVADRLVGAWEGDGKLFGRDAAFHMTWEWVLDHQFLRLTFRNGMETPDGVQLVLEAQAFYGPIEGGRFQGTWFDSRGVVQPLKGDAEANVLTVHWGSPETEEGRTIYRVIDEGRVAVEDAVLKAGEWVRFGDATYRRAASP